MNLKVSPLAVGRRGRLLLDLSFPSQTARPASKWGRQIGGSPTISPVS
jgi:hypothetical protein